MALIEPSIAMAIGRAPWMRRSNHAGYKLERTCAASQIGMNQSTYERKCGRQDQSFAIVVTQISHASMKKYQPLPQSIHLNHDLAATGHGTAHFDLCLTRS
jgi:hypothetical protein